MGFTTVYPYIAGHFLGRGMVKLPYIPRSDVVTFQDIEYTTSTPQNAFILSLFNVSSYKSLVEELNVNVDVEIDAGLYGTYGAEFNYANSSESNSYSEYLVASMSYSTGFKTGRYPQFIPYAWDMIERGEMDNFRVFGGDGFVRSQIDGGSLVLIVRAETKDEHNREAIKAGFSANICRVVDVNVDVEHVSESLQRSESFSVYLKQMGGTQLEAVTNLDDAIDKIRRFPQDVSTSPITYAFEAVDYGVVPRPPGPNYVDIQARNDTILYCGQMYRILKGIQNDILFIASHRDQFVNVSNYPLDEYNALINEDLNILKETASTCVNNIPACVRPEPERPIGIDYPLPSRRVPTTPRPPDLPVIPWASLQQRTVERRETGNQGKVTSTFERRGNSNDLIIRGEGELAFNQIMEVIS